MKAELVLGNLRREREALNNKLDRLDTALQKDWQDNDQEYLCTQQYNAMCLYAHILDERIADIECKLEEKKAEQMCNMQHETSHKDESIFNEKIDLGSYKDYVKSNCQKESCSCKDIDPEQAFIDIIESIFGIDIVK